MSPARKTQAERRSATRASVLDAAIQLFGTKGYADTALEEIASLAGMTIRPIYHYFGSKLELFQAVNEIMEERIVDSLQQVDADPMEAWRRYLTLCEDESFRRIVLLDSPHVLGRERWGGSVVTRTFAARFSGSPGGTEPTLAARMWMGALAEAALAIAESDDPTKTNRDAEGLVQLTAHALALAKAEHRAGEAKDPKGKNR